MQDMVPTTTDSTENVGDSNEINHDHGPQVSDSDVSRSDIVDDGSPLKRSQSANEGSNDNIITAKPPRRNKPKMHTRTPSYNKVNTINRPNLNRSKSTDGIVRIKRNNRSFTKIATLQPLTKTLSNQSLKSNKSNTSLKNLNINLAYGGLKLSAKQGKAILKLNDDNDEYEDLSDEEANELENSAELLAQQSLQQQQPTPEQQATPLPEPEQPQEAEISNNTQDNDMQHVFQQALGQYVSEPEVNKENHLSPSPRPELYTSGVQSDPLIKTEPLDSHPKQPTTHNIQEALRSKSPESPSSQEGSKQDITTEQSDDRLNKLPDSTDDLTPSSNLYGGSLFLSQSTGLIRKIDPKQMEYPSEGNEGESYNDSNGGISFKANPIDLNVAEPVLTNKPAVKLNSYQPNQTIFNNLQRTNNQYVNSKKQSQQKASDEKNGIEPAKSRAIPPQHIQLKDLGVTDFANFLNNNVNLNDGNDNRTQQRLWLQRENSLMDVSIDPNQLANFSSLSLNKLMFAHNYNQSNQHLNQMTPQTPSGGFQLGMTPINNELQNHQPGGIVTANHQSASVPHQNNGVNVSVTSVNNSSSTSQSTTPNDNPPLQNSVSTTNINGLLYMLQNGSTNLIQSRIEFERLNREYLNVRRYLNPIGVSLNRVKNNTIKIKKSNDKKDVNNDANTFEEFSPNFKDKEEEINNTLNKIWQDALISTSSVAQNQSNTSLNASMQRPQIARLPSRNQYMNLRNSQTPTTRAVKFAAAQAAANRQ
ncbi:hypothetical protein CLIB1444_09S04280 [[Candida] jaroonii]|uniref:Uncharacterized protein n=1 Tax=[Candida] jaroonii TaxID=467808 RepID=A0ACA9YBN5_9ASCO|nr:hypothetical protein CLIB1444_09S04280 [[Candida] jaroonii]